MLTYADATLLVNPAGPFIPKRFLNHDAATVAPAVVATPTGWVTGAIWDVDGGVMAGRT
jgi:hypothetical protein